MNNIRTANIHTKSSCVIHEHLLGYDGRLRQYEGETASGIHWAHIEYTNPGALAWLVAAGLPEVAAETMTRTETRPRVFTFDQGTLLNLRGVNLNPGEDPEDMVSVRLWLGKGRIITARQRRIISIEDMLQDFEKTNGPASEGEFLVSLVEHLASRIGEAVDTIDDQIATFEDELGAPSVSRAPLSKIRRQTAALRRFLAPQREALESMYRVSRDWLDENEAHYLREQADRITRYVEDLDLNRERALVLQEELQNRIAQEQNSRGFLLTIIATIFLPLSFLTGVFGMNVAGLPGTVNPAAFTYLSIAMLVIGILLLVIMRYKRWF